MAAASSAAGVVMTAIAPRRWRLARCGFGRRACFSLLLFLFRGLVFFEVLVDFDDALLSLDAFIVFLFGVLFFRRDIGAEGNIHALVEMRFSHHFAKRSGFLVVEGLLFQLFNIVIDRVAVNGLEVILFFVDHFF